jgi:hypothetical protein
VILAHVNQAAGLGPARFDWWPDWRGECVAIVASGPSTRKADVELLRERIHVIAIKENVDLCPWADVIYGCDAAWWVSRKGLPQFAGLKLAYDKTLPRHYPDIKTIEIKISSDAILTDQPGLVGSGGNSGFQALNMAVQFGVNGVILLGFDVHGKNGLHWYGPNKALGMSNPSDSNFARWQKSFEGVAQDLRQRGIAVVNASPISALKCFARKSVADALADWGL